MSGLAAGLHARGYDMLVIQIDVARYGLDLPLPRLRPRRRFRADGSQCTAKHLEALEARGAPFVVWGLDSTSHAYSTVSGDSYAGGRIATSTCSNGGGGGSPSSAGPIRSRSRMDRYRGYATALRAAHIGVDESLVTFGWYSSESATVRMRDLLARRPGHRRGLRLQRRHGHRRNRGDACRTVCVAARRCCRWLRRHRACRAHEPAADDRSPGRPTGGPPARRQPDSATEHGCRWTRLDPRRAGCSAVQLTVVEPTLFLRCFATGFINICPDLSFSSRAGSSS